MSETNFKKGQKVSFTISHRAGTSQGKAVVLGKSEDSGRLRIEREDGSVAKVWPSQLRAA